MIVLRYAVFLVGFMLVGITFWFLDLQATTMFLAGLLSPLPITIPTVDVLGAPISIPALIVQWTISAGQIVTFHRVAFTQDARILAMVFTLINFSMNVVIVYSSWIESSVWFVKLFWTVVCSGLTVLAPELLIVLGVMHSWNAIRAQQTGSFFGQMFHSGRRLGESGHTESRDSRIPQTGTVASGTGHLRMGSTRDTSTSSNSVFRRITFPANPISDDEYDGRRELS